MLCVCRGLLKQPAEAGAVEDVIAQNHGAGLVPDKFLAQQKRLCQPIGRRLLRIGQAHAELAAVAQQPFKVRQIGRRGDEKNIPDARKHQSGKGVVDHGLIVNGKQLLRRHHGQGIEPRS